MATIRTAYKYACDLDKGTYEVNLRNALMQADAQADAFRVSVTRNGADVAVSGMNAYGYLYVAANQTTIALKGTVSGNTAEVVLTSDCYAVPGYASLVIQLQEGDVRHTVLKVNMYIERTGGNRVLTGGDVLPTLAELLTKISAMEQATNTANETIATIKADTAAAIKATNEATAATQTATVELAKTAAPAITPTVSGSIVSITDGAERPAVSLVSHIEPVQEGEGDPSPNNKRPISGWDSVTAQRAGKNICPGYKIGAYVNTTGTYDANYTSYCCTELIRVTDGDKLIESHGGTSRAETYHYYDAKKGWLGNGHNINVRPAGATYIAINYIGTDLQWVQVEAGEVATAHEPYSGQTISADLPETVYGGTLDWGTGIFTVTHYKYVADGTANIFAGPQAHLYYRVGIQLPKVGAAYNIGNPICDRIAHNPDVFFDTIDNVGFCAHDLELYIRFGSDSGFTTTDAIMAYLTENPMTFVYQLAEPYTIQLTPQQLITLKGTNNVWSDTGDTDLTYIADTELYINQRLAAISGASL